MKMGGAMIDEHERLQEDVAAYALGALDAAERERVEAHLRACDECPRLLAEYRQIGDLLPHALPLQVPPSAVRDELLARARASKLLRGTTPLGPYPMKAGVADVGRPKPANTLTRVLRPLGWAAAVAALLVLLIWNIMLQM